MEKSLKDLKRMELLQLLMKVTQANEGLVAENAALRRDMAQARSQIAQASRIAQPQPQPQPEERTPQPQAQQRFPQAAKVGSIAEAALQANGYFEAAQRAADDYLREIKLLRDRLAGRVAAEAQVQPRAGTQAQMQPVQQEGGQAALQEAQRRADAIIGQANRQAQAIVTGARTQSDEIIARANRHSRDILSQANRRADALIEAAEASNRRSSEPQSTGPLVARGRHGRHAKFADGAVG